MRYLYLASYLLLIMFSVSGCQEKTNDPSLVYEAFFKHVNRKQNIHYIKKDISTPKNHMPSKDQQQFFDSFTFPNTLKSHNLEHFNKIQVNLISLKERRSFFKSGCKLGWQAFHNKYPKAQILIGFSQVGYNSYNEAILYAEAGSGCLRGQGGFYIFERKKGVWSFKDHLNLWVA